MLFSYLRRGTMAVCFLLLLAAGRAAAIPPDGIILKRDMPKDWIVRMHWRIAPRYPYDNPREQLEFKLENTPLYVPMIPESGFSKSFTELLKGRLTLNKQEVPSAFTLEPISGLESRLCKFVVPKYTGREIDLHLEQTLATWNSVLDEKTALQIPWPDKWPPEVTSALQPQFYIDFKLPEISAVAKRLLGENPRAMTPYATAKMFARFIGENFQRSGKSLTNDHRGLMNGFEIAGAEKVAGTMRGSHHDAICLFVALCRSAGIPARPVIGIDTTEKKDGELTAWAEVYIPRAGWAPFDLRPIFSGPGKAKDIMRPWEGVGTNNDLNEMIPLAFHYRPQMGAVLAASDAAPMLWAWQPQPEQIPADQNLTFEFLRTASNPKLRGE